jgi:type I restriction enzyme S subunit
VLKIPEMMEYELLIPDIEEQKQIAGYLNSLDELIELYQMRIEKLKNIKAACLQGMFV